MIRHGHPGLPRVRCRSFFRIAGPACSFSPGRRGESVLVSLGVTHVKLRASSRYCQRFFEHLFVIRPSYSCFFKHIPQLRVRHKRKACPLICGKPTLPHLPGLFRPCDNMGVPGAKSSLLPEILPLFVKYGLLLNVRVTYPGHLFHFDLQLRVRVYYHDQCAVVSVLVMERHHIPAPKIIPYRYRCRPGLLTLRTPHSLLKRLFCRRPFSRRLFCH